MYARGTNFNLTSNVTLLLMAAGGLGMTATGGNGVIYLSAVEMAGSGTNNAGQLVIAERFVIGNSSFASSRIGTPASSIWPDTHEPLPNGLVHDFENQSSALVTPGSLPPAFGLIAVNERIYVVEVSYSLANIGGWTRVFGLDRVYTRALY